MSLKHNFDICLIELTDTVRAPRVPNEAASLAAAGWRVVFLEISLGGPQLPREEIIDGYTTIRVSPGFMRQRWHYRGGQFVRLALALPGIARALRRLNARVYHANDFTGLLLVALAGLSKRQVVYDAHELFFDRPLAEMPPLVRFAIFRMRVLEKRLARRTVAALTVSEGIADILRDTLEIPRPTVIYNAVDLRKNRPSAVRYEVKGRRAVVHPGRLVDGRHLPDLVAALQHLPEDIALVFMGHGPLESKLIEQAARQGTADRLLIVSQVPRDQIATTMEQADAAAVLTASNGLNGEHALPNKIFEAVAAGLPVVCGPNPEIKAMTEKYQLGISCDSRNPASIASAVLQVLLPENRERFAANALKAREFLNWQQQEQILIDFYSRILGQP